MKFSKKYWLIIITVAVIIGAYWWYKSNASKTTTIPQTATVSRGTLVTSVNGSGSLTSRTVAEVTVEGLGIVDEVFVKSGDHVAAGQKLFHLKSLASAADVAKARAEYHSSQAGLISAQQQAQDAVANEEILNKNLNASMLAYQAAQVDAKKSVKNAEKDIVDAMDVAVNNNLDILSAQQGEQIAELGLTSTQLKARQNLITAQSTVASAKRDSSSASLKRKSAQASLVASQASATSSNLAFQEVLDQNITAPIAGQVANMNLGLGSVVGQKNSAGSTASSDSSTSSSSVFSIIDPNKLSVSVAISEVDIPNIKINQIATITFDSLSGKTFAGHVVNVDTMGTTNSGVTTYNVEIMLDEADEAVRPGMSASAAIITNRKDGVLLVPSGAIRTQNNQQAVTVLKDGLELPVGVTAGLSNDLETEIIEGLNEGDLVILGTQTENTFSRTNTSLFGGSNRGGGPVIRGF